MSKAQRISTGYVPRPIQAELHKSLKRFNVLVCHRRFGKSVFSINHMIDSGLRNPLKEPRYAYLAPLYGQVKRVAWDYLKGYTRNIPGATSNEADLRVDIPRPAMGDSIRFSLLGADNPDALRGIYLDGAVLDEYAQMNPIAWREVIRPALSDRTGWCIFIGTPKGRNSFWELYDRATSGFPAKEGGLLKDPEWFSAVYKASETGLISQAELESAAREMSEEEYEQEFECSFSAGLVGAYFTKQMDAAEKEGRITSVPYDPSIPVTTFWDLGMSDTTVIWFMQEYGQQIRLIDYLEESGSGLDYYAKRLREKGYTFDEIRLPHDANVRELGTGNSRFETMRSLMPHVRVKVEQKQSVEDGINAIRMLLPRCVFDKDKCSRGIKALQNYERAWNAKTQIFENRPLHNWASHGADAFRYLAMGTRKQRVNKVVLPDRAEMEWNVFG